MKPISRKETIIIITTLVVLVVGLFLEWPSGGCWNAFRRFGSVVVCVAIGFGIRDLKSVYADRFEDLVRKLEENRLENDIVFSDEELDAEFRGSTNDLISRERSISESGEKRVILLDTTVLILGTVIWGFGDLILRAVIWDFGDLCI